MVTELEILENKFKSRFKRFGGDLIPDVVEYLKDYISKSPYTTISIGCDSIQKRKRTLYAITIMMYDSDIKNGAHVIFFRESIDKIRDIENRLGKEAVYMYELGTYINEKLSGFYNRKDLTDFERKRYKFHIAKSNGEYPHVTVYNEGDVIENVFLSALDLSYDFKLVDIHLDFNPVENAKNKSNVAYKQYSPWLRGIGYRVWSKHESFAATSAADLLVQD